MAAPELAAPPQPLTAFDRCDQCGAQALLRVTMPSGSGLLFCRHHGHQHAARLAQDGAVVEDCSDTLPR